MVSLQPTCIRLALGVSTTSLPTWHGDFSCSLALRSTASLTVYSFCWRIFLVGGLPASVQFPLEVFPGRRHPCQCTVFAGGFSWSAASLPVYRFRWRFEIEYIVLMLYSDRLDSICNVQERNQRSSVVSENLPIMKCCCSFSRPRHPPSQSERPSPDPSPAALPSSSLSISAGIILDDPSARPQTMIYIYIYTWVCRSNRTFPELKWA